MNNKEYAILEQIYNKCIDCIDNIDDNDKSILITYLYLADAITAETYYDYCADASAWDTIKYKCKYALDTLIYGYRLKKKFDEVVQKKSKAVKNMQNPNDFF